MAKGADERIRELERDLARDPRDAAARLALARELDRARRREAAARHVDHVLRDDPLHEGALSALDELDLPPLALGAPWPTVAGGNDRARRSTEPGARKGTLVRRIRVGAALRGEPESAASLTVGGDGAAYLATSRARLIALDLASGEPRWVRDDLPLALAPPVGAGDRLAVAGPGEVHLIDGRREGRTLWRAAVGPREAFPLVAFALRRLVLAVSGAELVALDAVTGRARWRVPLEGPAIGVPALRDQRAYVLTAEGVVHEVDVEGRVTGKARTSRGAAPRGLVALEDALYVGFEGGRPGVVHAIARTPGTPLEGRSNVVRLDGTHVLGCSLGPGRLLACGLSPGVVERGVATPVTAELLLAPGPVADSAGMAYGLVFERSLARDAAGLPPIAQKLAWFDPSPGLVGTVQDVAPGTLAVGPDATVLVASRDRGILQVIA